MSHERNDQFLKDLIKVFIIPTVINKPIMFYFGLNYSNYPGEGYGNGLVATIAVFITSMGYFLYKYRNNSDP